jgi:hypothetical protein
MASYSRRMVPAPKQASRVVARPDNRYVVGAGSAPNKARQAVAESKVAGFGSILDLMKNSMDTPYWNMDVIEQVRWTMTGPQTDESVQKNFGSEIDLYGSGKSPTGIDFVETTMAQTGQTQTHFVACYIGFHMEPEPLCWTARGNASTHPTSEVAMPPSPDVFTQNDRANGAINAAVASGAATFLPAVLRWGWWANYVCWHMARAYNLRWKIGQHINIMDEQLRHTAYMPPSAQEGSASSSQVDIVTFVSNLNRRYDSLGSALDFLPVDFIRVASDPVVGGGANVGRFVPTRDFEIVDATYGGMDLRSMLKGNSEMRKLCVPYVIKPGVPIGLFLQECDTVQADTMRQFLSITQGIGGAIPPILTPDENYIAEPTSTGADVMLERTLAGADVPQQVDAERVVFEGGDLKLTLPIRGFEVSADWYNTLSSDPDVRAAVFDCVGMRFAV